MYTLCGNSGFVSSSSSSFGLSGDSLSGRKEGTEPILTLGTSATSSSTVSQTTWPLTRRFLIVGSVLNSRSMAPATALSLIVSKPSSNRSLVVVMGSL